jgi:drug/metabolite transporter superfamily protein YnfA
MRNFWNSFWNSFWNTLKEQQFFWTVIETVITLTIFSIITHLFFAGEGSSFAAMVAGGALFIAISSRRRLDNK